MIYHNALRTQCIVTSRGGTGFRDMPLKDGRDYDFSRPFFDQFADLMMDVPKLGANVMSVQNRDFVNQCGWSKNCYFTVEADENQDCMYGYRIFYNKTCIDCTEVTKSERCYECTDCDKCFNLRFSKRKIPLPHLHPDERHARRMALRNPRKLWKRQCGRCGREIETTYSLERPETIFCEECYLQAVY